MTNSLVNTPQELRAANAFLKAVDGALVDADTLLYASPFPVDILMPGTGLFAAQKIPLEDLKYIESAGYPLELYAQHVYENVVVPAVTNFMDRAKAPYYGLYVRIVERPRNLSDQAPQYRKRQVIEECRAAVIECNARVAQDLHNMKVGRAEPQKSSSDESLSAVISVAVRQGCFRALSQAFEENKKKLFSRPPHIDWAVIARPEGGSAPVLFLTPFAKVFALYVFEQAFDDAHRRLLSLERQPVDEALARRNAWYKAVRERKDLQPFSPHTPYTLINYG